MSLTCSVSGCVFLPALALLRVGMHTVCALLVWSGARSVSSRGSWLSALCFVCHCGRSALGERSLRRALPPAFPAVRVPPLPRQSGALNRGDRRWIWQKDWRRARPFLLLPLLDLGTHSLGTEARSLTVSSAPREGSAVALVFLWGGRWCDRRSRRGCWFATQSVLLRSYWRW